MRFKVKTKKVINHKTVYKGRDNMVAYLMLSPWLFGFALMWLLPMIISIYYSFTDFNLLNVPKIIGLQNYIRIFTEDTTFRQALMVTFLYVVLLVPLRLAFALFVAMLLNKKHRGLGLYRTLYYIPSIIGGSIAVSVVWKQIFGNRGVVMSILAALGIEQKISLLGNPKTALSVIILMGVWQFGSSMLIFLAALKQIPNSLYESARVDGARSWRIFLKITLPMLTPTIFFNLILQIVNGFRVFTESYVITGGGPLDSTLSYVLYLYRRAFTYFDMGYSCALAWVLVAIIAVFTVVIFKTQKNWVYYETEAN
ncbi:carbohydrate ABC transporter permease [Anaerotaenia torta]|uniref:carbohydrate ABC transporter permease n=1 Tax=Anaerotaenia torta TaxID=433293 RepID=UPI003D1985EA